VHAARPRARTLLRTAFDGALQAIDQTDEAATLQANGLAHHSAGTTRHRRDWDQPLGSRSSLVDEPSTRPTTAADSVRNLALPATFFRGSGGYYYDKEDGTNCTLAHYHKKLLGSINPRARL
jgi:hypothetical protein